ncbi:hypothetical protein [Kutzneria buriramensis]|uniref:Uncharacterized protein n=1 Tax=Kutzneria buriramensis TaxID=1045776 RepID=A0A3E0GSS2_9PSEU|nr:hypothetical protein [Kutzneria buriramensis]REH25995.1 hypothetical protein BCF44_13534 [Kutzneria buriramensis]
MKVRSFLAWPFVVLFDLIRMLLIPAAVVTGGWLWAPLNVALVLTGLAGIYTLIVLSIWRLRLRASLRTLGRGTIVIAGPATEDDYRRRSRRGR